MSPGKDTGSLYIYTLMSPIYILRGFGTDETRICGYRRSEFIH